MSKTEHAKKTCALIITQISNLRIDIAPSNLLRTITIRVLTWNMCVLSFFLSSNTLENSRISQYLHRKMIGKTNPTTTRSFYKKKANLLSRWQQFSSYRENCKPSFERFLYPYQNIFHPLHSWSRNRHIHQFYSFVVLGRFSLSPILYIKQRMKHIDGF